MTRQQRSAGLLSTLTGIATAALLLLQGGCQPEPSDDDDHTPLESPDPGDDDSPAGDDDSPAGDDDSPAGDDDSPVDPGDGDGDGYNEAGGDCDDQDAAVHPEAAEVRDDGVDQDCDGADYTTVEMLEVLFDIIEPTVEIADAVEEDGLRYFNDLLFIGFLEPTAPGEAQAVVAAVGGAIDGKLSTLGYWVRVAPTDLEGLITHLETLTADPRVEGGNIEIVATGIEAAAIPSGPDVSTSGLSEAQRWAFDRTRFVDAWQVLEEEHLLFQHEVKVAVIDSGFDTDHPELEWDLEHAINFVDKSDPMPERSGQTHGTLVSGLVGARNDGHGINGFAPDLAIVPLTVGDDKGDLKLLSVNSAIVAACGTEGVRAINISLSYYGSFLHYNPFDDLYMHFSWQRSISDAVAKGCQVVVAAGNAGADIDDEYYPAKLDDTITVGATALDAEGREKRWSDSNWGGIELAAPGGSIYTTDNNPACSAADREPCYTTASGTSLASPIVAGAVALLSQIDFAAQGGTDLAADQEGVTQLLRNTGDRIETDHGVWFRINLYNAVMQLRYGSRPPGAPKLSLPACGAEIQPEEITFEWGAGIDPEGDAVHYKLELRQGESGQIQEMITDLDQTRYTGLELEPLTTYSYRITAYDSAGAYDRSAWCGFRTLGGSSYDDDLDGYTEEQGDCDDLEPQVHPGQTEGRNEIDDDCDGIKDEGFPGYLAPVDVQLVGEASYDRAGQAVAGCDVNGDGFSDIIAGAPENDSSAEEAGTLYVVYGPVSGTVELADAPARLYGERGGDWSEADRAGSTVACAGDINGDGKEDVLVGVANQDAGGTDAGAVYLFYGPLSGAQRLSEADAKLVGEMAHDYAGMTAVPAGDVNNDGVGDILVGAPGHSTGGTSTGAAYVVFGPISGVVDLEHADIKLTGESSYDYAGGALAAGDLDGDGHQDLVIGAQGNEEGARYAGAVYLLFGPISRSRSLADADVKILGEQVEQGVARSVAIGDLNGDGRPDLSITAEGFSPDASWTGMLYILYGPFGPGPYRLSEATAIISDPREITEEPDFTAAMAGDFNGDGLEDLLLGAPGYGEGAIYLFYGPVQGDLDVSAADRMFEGGGTAGISVASGGDINGDGYADLLVGEPMGSSAGNWPGLVYGLFGRAD